MLGDLQNSFRTGRRLDDSLFVLTQLIEITQSEGRPLWITFLDIKGAHDAVVHASLWERLEVMGMRRATVDLIREIYKNNKVRIRWEGELTEWVNMKRELRQGCPLSYSCCISGK